MGSPELAGNSLPQLSKSNSSNQVAWDRLPPNTIERIFSFLSHKDRSVASTVCKAWADAYESPDLWRCPVFKFSKNQNSKRKFNQRETLNRFGSFFRKLVIMYSRPKSKSMKFISRQISDFLQEMTDTGLQLKSIRMARLMILEMSCSRHSFFCQKMTDFLKTQTGLTHVDFSNGRTFQSSGVEVLESLVPENVHHLMLKNFFETQFSGISTSDRYLSAMSRFSALRTLSLNYNYLSDQVMTCLTNTLSSDFEEFSIFCKKIRSLTLVISDTSWISLKRKCPKMIVRFRLDNDNLSGTFIINSNILSAKMPLHTMQYRLKRAWNEQYDHPIFDYLANRFSDTLKELEFDIEGYEDLDVRTGIVDIVGRCTMLENLTLRARFPTFDTRDLFERLLEALFTQITENETMSMKIFRATFRGLWREKRKTAMLLERVYGPKFRDIGVSLIVRIKK